ncbi:hypothetical protein FKW77_008508 [Venturia effusa]|uniref:Uncharacterized protein n=1 Tax=Venturia effusa TaxID=50376 RepID=A0A517LKX0_9PEZI|nr:hypothetical protein FKW77_008508 [Venturia effusa]
MAATYIENQVVDCTILPDLEKLKEKTVIVTGGKNSMDGLEDGTYRELVGSSGLGAAYVKAFSNAGAHVTIADLNENRELAALNNVQYTRCDVRVWADQLAAFQSALKKSPNGRIDIVVANAGILADDPIVAIGMRIVPLTMGPSQLPSVSANLQSDESEEPQEPDLRVAQVNILGVLYTTKLALHYFSKSSLPPHEKCLILKSSVAGYIDLPNAAGYQTRRALGVMPRFKIESGYVDLEADDYAKGHLLHELESIAVSMNQGSMPANDL